ncbi:RNA-guided endonuclease InsQ/TnpB family protein [Microseira sp. BLCC-F43]|jgi:IS605 OrfB family transposase|uniref:RNA-guided endonuclease InsQ/TnpB family protein n=1 Tax=Microseira sp. BLCC-F43 TaxID=3153602 RepID=UPI0035B80276
MLQSLTAKLKLVATPEQKEMLARASLAYRDALNFTSSVAYQMGKTYNGTKIQKEVYYTLREGFKLPSQMACNVPRQVGATYKSLRTKLKQNEEALIAGRTKKRYKGLDKPPKFVSRTCTLNYQRDYSFVKDQKVSVITLDGRIKVSYQGYSKHLQMIQSGVAKIGAAKLWYSKSTKTYYLLVSMSVEVSDLTPTDINRVMGVDVGQRYIAVAADTRNKTQFFSGAYVRHKASRYVRARKSLQRKGTRSATRRLVALSRRERRFIADTNHCIAKKVVTPRTLIGLENLTHIRERTKPKKKGKKASKKKRKANSNRARWSFAELHGFIDYKAVLSGSLAVKVDAHYTSCACPCCGHTSKENRPNKGLTFVCQQCGYTLHADLVGARNVALRVLLSRQSWESTGRFSAVPDVSSDEGKAERLSRYSELRWTVDTISTLNETKPFEGEVE